MHPPILAIDPGSTQSAYVLMSNGLVIEFGKHPNADILKAVRAFRAIHPDGVLAIEMIASYGMPVGSEVFDTCVWTGRFVEAWDGGDGRETVYAKRKAVVTHLCGSSKAKDSNVRQALIDLVGPQGTKKNPGPTYGMKADTWSALAVAVYAKAALGE
jgi:hypothetical protein